jgi:negative regulator of flagellin synthesis FlgM
VRVKELDMKIDPTVSSTSELRDERVQTAQSNKARIQQEGNAAQPNAVQSGDTFQLSSKHGEMQQLTAQVAKIPEVRMERVVPLQAKVQSGSYKPDSKKVAEAMMSEQAQKSAKP